MAAPLTAWVKPPQSIRGLDHLGVRAPCESLYAQLVPGITNVTDRARYFSFYPWLIWAVEQYKGRLRELPFFQILRRADCLLTLIAARHRVVDEVSDALHGAMIGAITLFPALARLGEGGSLRLSAFATTESEEGRYFKNKLGGLGQYYLGTLRDADILAGDLRTGVRYRKGDGREGRGLKLAEAFDRGVDRRRFFAALDSDKVTADTLDELVPFCPCQLHVNEPEHSALADLFFNREGDFHDPEGVPRRQTLALLLDLTGRLQGTDDALTVDGVGVDVFRACAYAGALPDGSPWSLSLEELERQQRGWRYYHRYELFSVAVQGIFWAGLDELQEQGIRPAHSEEYMRWFVDTFAGELEGGGEEPFGDAVRRTAADLVPLELWNGPEHEVQLGWKIHNLSRAEDATRQRREVLRTSMKILLALVSLDQEPDVNEPVGLPPHYLIQYPVNLLNFERHAKDGWRSMPLRELIGWLATQWGVGAHLRVALRKLRYESRDTFRIKPTDQGLVVTEAPIPSFTSPRLKQSLQILHDLRAIDMDPETGGMALTAFGSRMLEECRRE
jgi:hypothetical protein